MQKRFLIFFLVFMAIHAPGLTANDFSEYFAAKAEFSKEIIAKTDISKGLDQQKGDERAIKALEGMMRQKLGEVVFATRPNAISFQPETLLPTIEAGCLDGFVYQFQESKTVPSSIFVTDFAVLSEHRRGSKQNDIKNLSDIAAEIDQVNCKENARFQVVSEIPVVPSSSDSCAYVGYFTQDVNPSIPTDLFVAVKRATKLYLADFTKLDPPPPTGNECNKKWGAALAKREENFRKYRSCVNSKKKNGTSIIECGKNPSESTDKEFEERTVCYHEEFIRSKLADTYGAYVKSVLKLIPK
jgi:hypothetical protein